MNEQLVRDCLRMFREREDYYKEEWNKEFDKNGFPPDNLWGMMMAYNNAATMLEYALRGNRKALSQFDYYNRKDN